ncbi:hypothetical protein Efla_001273 [Eimeria flavescens]
MTHKWTCLLRSPEGEDISYFIKKVVFELDPSFVNPRRTLTAPPYEVSEAGWGEFCLTARIFLVDESLPPVEMSHFLRLNLPGTSQGPCVASETYDELLIYEPSDWFYDKVTSAPLTLAPPHPLSPYFLQTASVEESQLQLCLGLQGYVQARFLVAAAACLNAAAALTGASTALAGAGAAHDTESIALMQEAFLLTLQIQELQRQHETITSGNASAAAAAAPVAVTPAQGEGGDKNGAPAPTASLSVGCTDSSAAAPAASATPTRQGAQLFAFPMGSCNAPSTHSNIYARGVPLGTPASYESPKSPQCSMGSDCQQQQPQQQTKGLMISQPHPPPAMQAQNQHLLQHQQQHMLQQQQLLQHQQIMQQQDRQLMQQPHQHYMPKLHQQVLASAGPPPQQQQQPILPQQQIGHMPVGPGPL